MSSPVNYDAYSKLAQFLKKPLGPARPQSSSGPAVPDVARFILANSSVAPGKPAEKNQQEKDPSLMSRIFDILSRGNYAAANAADEAMDRSNDVGDILGAAWEGFTGREKTTYSDVLDTAGMEEGLGRSALGLGLDIAADPINFIPVAGIVNKFKRGKNLLPPEKPLEDQILSKGEPVYPETFGLPTRSQEVPRAFRKQKATQPLPEPAGPRPRVELPVDAVPPQQLALPLPPLAGEAGLLARQPAPKPENLTKTLRGSGQGEFSFKSYKKGSIWKDPRLTKVREELNKGAFGANKVLDRVIEGDPKASQALDPKPIPPLHPFGDRKIQELADRITSGVSKSQLAKKSELSRADQVTLWKRARESAAEMVKKKKGPKGAVQENILVRTLKIYGEVERQFANAGKTFETRLGDVLGDLVSRSVPLTDDIVKEFINPKPGSEVWRSLQGIQARKAVTDAPTVKKIADAVSESITEARVGGTKSFAEIKDFEAFLKGFSKNVAKNKANLSEAGIKATSGIVKEALVAGKNPAQIAIEHKIDIVDNILKTGKNSTELADAVTNGLAKEMGSLPKNSAKNSGEWIMARMSTSWGQKDLRPLTLNALASAQATAKARGDWLNRVFTGYDEAQRGQAMLVAQGYKAADNPQIDELADNINRLMENLAGKVTGQSVVTRAAIPSEMLNKWLKRYGSELKFGMTAIDPITKKKVQLDNWLDSWKYTDVKGDSQKFLFTVQQAIEQATRERAVFDDLGQRFGSRFRNADYRHTLDNHPYLEGYYFPKEIAEQIPKMVDDWSIPAWTPKSPIIQKYDRVLSMWKASVTIYRPGHHTRNMAGDMYLGWMDGVNSAKPYGLALKVLKTQRNSYPDLADIDDLIELGLAPRTMRTPNPKDILFRNKSGEAFTPAQIFAVAHQHGLLESAQTAEDIISFGEKAFGTGAASLTRPLGGRGQKVARGASELQLHTARLAHFIDKVKKSKGKDLGKIFDEAVRRSRKWHPTALDLTDFEKKYFRRVIPFYSWLRKSTPLLLEGMVMHPGKTVVPAKVMESVQEFATGEDVDRLDPFAHIDQMFPSWIREQGIGPLPPEGLLGSLSNQNPEGAVMVGQGLNPLTQLMGDLEAGQEGPQGIFHHLATSTSPAIKIPTELAFGRDMFTGAPIHGDEAMPGAFKEYMGKQLPGISYAQRGTGMTPFGSETKKGGRGESSLSEELVNWFTGLGIKGTGPYERSGRYEKMAPQWKQEKIDREQFLRMLREG